MLGMALSRINRDEMLNVSLNTDINSFNRKLKINKRCRFMKKKSNKIKWFQVELAVKGFYES